ncbi:MAG TPA: porin, partial [Gammaproteobacteria bacterium]|nr:porin [Gammaproteobacteria bacterium]MCH78296.1 porin [Gammaproteobacteria bacterium]
MKQLMCAGLALTVLAAPVSVQANDDEELAELKALIQDMRQNYEERLSELEQRLAAAEAR